MEFRKWYEDLNPGARKAAIGVFAILVLILVSAVSSCFNDAEAVEPGWYAPLDGSGQGIIVRCNADGECAANWLTYAHGEQIWLLTVANCPRGETCAAEFARTSGYWFGREFEFGPVEVTAELEPTADSILVDFNAIALFPDACTDIGPGGLLLRNCIGVKEFFLLAR